MRIKKKSLKIILIIAATVIILSLLTVYLQKLIGAQMMKNVKVSIKSNTTSATGYNSADPSRFSKECANVQGYSKQAETEYLILLVRDDNQAIKIYDKRTQKMWNSVIEDTTINENYVNQAISLFTFNYIDLSNVLLEKTQTTLAEQEFDTERVNIENGVRIKFVFKKLAINIALDFVLTDSELTVKILDKNIYENENGAQAVAKAKESMQEQIAQFQKSTDSFKNLLGKYKLDENTNEQVRVLTNEVYNILVRIKETAGTDKFQGTDLNTIGEDFMIIKSAIGDTAPEATAAIEKLQQQIDKITLNIKTFQNNKACGITEMNIMPNFGAADNKTDGYVFYPDGNGALSYFNKTHPYACGTYLQDVYDVFYPTKKFNVYKEKDPMKVKQLIEPIKYPVFGIKQDNSAFAAIITDGDYDSSIYYNPSNDVYKYGNAGAVFNLRKVSINNNKSGGTFEVYDKIRTKHDWIISYKFLANDQANYSGMAMAYQKYLTDNSLLTKTKFIEDKMPLAVEFEMGIESTQNNIFRKYIPFTKWSDIDKFYEVLRTNGIDKTLMNVCFWTKHAYKNTNDQLIPASEIGSEAELKALASKVSKSGSLFSLEKSFVFFDKKDLSYSEKNNTTVKAMNMITLSIADDYNLLNPNYIFNKQMKDIKQLKSYRNNALTYDQIAKNLYYDYNKNGPVDRQNTFSIFNKMINETKKEIPYSVLYNTSSLYYKNTDWNADMDSSDNGYLFTDENVPFLQMVLHGYIPYTSGGLNEAADRKKALLRRLELGEIPFYRLTDDLPSDIKLEYFFGLYSTKINDWTKTIINDYKTYEETVNDFWNKRMIYHEQIMKDVSKTKYEDGTIVYINYSDREAVADNIKIPSMDFVIRKAGVNK